SVVAAKSEGVDDSFGFVAKKVGQVADQLLGIKPEGNAFITNCIVTPAESNGQGKWKLQHPDEGGKTVDVALPDGFTPDARLHMATDLKPDAVDTDLSKYSNWENALNTGRPVGDRLAGYNYDKNETCET